MYLEIRDECSTVASEDDADGKAEVAIMTEGWELSTRDLEVCRLGTFGWSGPLHYFVVEAGRFTKIRATRMTLIGCI